MKCNKCIATINIGSYEYPEMACLVTHDNDIKEFKDGSCGCSRRSYSKLEKDIKRQKEIEMEAMSNDFEKIVNFIEEEKQNVR